MTLTCFKAYDVRGRVGENLDEDVARRIGQAVANVLAPGEVAIGRDARTSSPALAAALAQGLREGGADVADIGLCGTEEVYFATAHLGAGGGIMVTASHNPKGWNGMKLVGPGSRPLLGGRVRRDPRRGLGRRAAGRTGGGRLARGGHAAGLCRATWPGWSRRGRWRR